MNITIIGTGRMARGIGTRIVAGGHQLTLLGREEAKAHALAHELAAAGAGSARGAALAADAITGEVVILALPYAAALDTARTFGQVLRGKVIIDITNSRNAVSPPAHSAAAALVQVLGPDARIVKAFNTIFAATLVAGQVAGEPLDVLVAGDDTQAKAVVSGLIRDGSLNPIDVGPLALAEQLEHMSMLTYLMQKPLGLGERSAWKLLRPQSSPVAENAPVVVA